MEDEKTTLDSSTATASSTVSTQTCDITVIYGSNDPDKGFNIPVDKITEIIIRENFFLLLSIIIFPPM